VWVNMDFGVTISAPDFWQIQVYDVFSVEV